MPKPVCRTSANNKWVVQPAEQKREQRGTAMHTHTERDMYCLCRIKATGVAQKEGTPTGVREKEPAVYTYVYNVDTIHIGNMYISVYIYIYV